ncbi:MAG: RsmE family RNA methyltransferase [Planctomycetales bacterium]|nr:RsmE family RNA methyltransferase [Planctomycetales bacterium]
MFSRFFTPQFFESGDLTLDGSEAHHLIHVMRIKPGEIVELFDGQGQTGQAEVVSVKKRDVELRILTICCEAPPSSEIIIGTAVPKGDRFAWLIEKATELGVTRIVPLTTVRSSSDPRDSKLERLRQTVVSACKQSGRNRILEIAPVTMWSEFVRHEFPNRSAYIAHPADPIQTDLRQPFLGKPNSSMLFAIGPEGGFTDEEFRLAIAAGGKPISLGPLILRVETAVLAVAALGLARQCL